MFVITSDGGLITGVHESRNAITTETFKDTAYEGQAVIEVPEDKASGISSGKYLGEYDTEWNLKLLSQRVAEGIIVVAPGYILDGETIRPMTLEERIAAGLDEPPHEPTLEEIAEQERQARIWELKNLLSVEDYKIIKAYEYSLLGIPLPYDITVLHDKRQAMRDEINELEVTA